jgi:hypothetical protein
MHGSSLFHVFSCSPKSQSFEQRIISTTSLVKKHQQLMGVTAFTTMLVSDVNNSVAAAVSIGAWSETYGSILCPKPCPNCAISCNNNLSKRGQA